MTERAIRPPRRSRDERLAGVVRAVIHEWDPYGLLSSGCPEDEFDREIAAVVRQVPRIRSERDARDAISRVFSSSFEPDTFRREKCEAVGRLLFERLSASGLLR